jgi:tetratricopeptide (TPR) repeat protein
MKRKLVYFFFILISFSAFGQLNTEKIIANGRVALYYKDYFLSIQYFNQVIKVKPFLPEPYMYRAIAKLSLDENQGAEQDCSLAIDLNPFLPEAYSCRAYARLGLSKYDEAIADFDKSIEFSPDNNSLFIARGAAKAEKKDYEGALVDYQQVIKKDSQNKEAYFERGRIHAIMNDSIAALNDFNKVIEIDKFSSIGWSVRGMMNLKMNKYKESISDFDEALLLEDRAGDHINRALAKYHVNDLRGAMADYDAALDLNPNEFLGYYNRGLLRAQVGDNNRAIEDFDMVLRFNPKEYTAVFNRATLKAEIGDNKGAIADYSAIIKQYPNFIPAYYGRSEVKKKMGLKKSAELDYMTAVHIENIEQEKKKANKKDIDPTAIKTRDEMDDDINNYKKIVVIDTEKERKKLKYQNDELRGEIQNVNVDIDIEKNFFLSYYSPENKIKTAMVYYYKGIEDYNAKQKLQNQLRLTNKEIQLSTDLIVMHLSMINEWSQRIEEDKTNPDSYFCRAINYALVQDFDNAIDSYTKAITLKSDFMLAYFCRANIRNKMMYYTNSSPDSKNLIETKKASSSLAIVPVEKEKKVDYDLIIHDYDKVIELAPDFIYAYFNRGNVFFSNNDFQSAIADYSEAIRREPDFAEAYFNRGLSYILAGEKAKGLLDLSKAGELGIHTAYNIIKRYS